jgi:hypothetical protein
VEPTPYSARCAPASGGVVGRARIVADTRYGHVTVRDSMRGIGNALCPFRGPLVLSGAIQ